MRECNPSSGREEDASRVSCCIGKRNPENKPVLIDLFCGAGGAARGYQQAGFFVVGVDIKPQPRYAGDVFVQGDALTFPLEGALAVHASPPCQAYSNVSSRNKKNKREYPKLIAPTRKRLLVYGSPYVIENVETARQELRNPIRLCGSSFGLDVRRHRLFELHGFDPVLLPPCAHHWQLPRFHSLDSQQKRLASVVGVHGHENYAGDFELRCEAMGIDWMDLEELNEAIPPAYTEWIGARLLEVVRQGVR